MKQDRLTVLSKMRPQTTLDAVWTADEQKVVRERILSDRTESVKAGSHRRRRAALAGAVTLGLVAVPGVAIAVGSGMVPQAFIDVYENWGGKGPSGSVDPSTASRAATAPGPFGGTFSVLTGKNEAGLTCLAPVIETKTSASEPLPDNFEELFGFCHSAPSTSPFRINTVEFTPSGTIWFADAGRATTAELRVPSGQTYPVVLVEGYFFGWYPEQAPGQQATLTGFAADGSEVGQTKV